MCGIVYAKRFDDTPINGVVLKRFKAQRSRGVEGFGFYLPQLDRLTHNTREGRIIRLLKRQPASEILFHHRLPTSTLNVRNACHPFSTGNTFEKNYILVHNGIIYNDDILAEAHKELGIRYVSQYQNSFNDSEALAYDVALYLEGKQTELKASGSIAFVVVQRDNDGTPLKLHFGRNTLSPLMLYRDKDQLILASEGKGEAIDPHQLYTFNYATNRLTKKALQIPEPVSNYSYGFGNSDNYGAWKYCPDCYTYVNTTSHPHFKNDELDEITELDASIEKIDYNEPSDIVRVTLDEANNDPFEALEYVQSELEYFKSHLDNILEAGYDNLQNKELELVEFITESLQDYSQAENILRDMITDFENSDYYNLSDTDRPELKDSLDPYGGK